MRHAVIAILVAAALCACATPEDPRASEFRSWSDQMNARANAGQVKFSDYYVEAYNRLNAIQTNDRRKLIAQQAYADLIPIARAYDNGQITREQFGDARRATDMAVQQQTAQLDQQRRQAIARAIDQAAENYRRSQPVNTTCTSAFNMVNCTTR